MRGLEEIGEEMTPEIKIIPGKPFLVGKKLMVQCSNCLKIIRIDKPIIGSLHVCN